MDYKKTVEEILAFIKLNMGKLDNYNENTYDYSQGYNKCLRDVINIIDRYLREGE